MQQWILLLCIVPLFYILIVFATCALATNGVMIKILLNTINNNKSLLNFPFAQTSHSFLREIFDTLNAHIIAFYNHSAADSGCCICGIYHAVVMNGTAFPIGKYFVCRLTEFCACAPETIRKRNRFIPCTCEVFGPCTAVIINFCFPMHTVRTYLIFFTSTILNIIQYCCPCCAVWSCMPVICNCFLCSDLCSLQQLLFCTECRNTTPCTFAIY